MRAELGDGGNNGSPIALSDTDSSLLKDVSPAEAVVTVIVPYLQAINERVENVHQKTTLGPKTLYYPVAIPRSHWFQLRQEQENIPKQTEWDNSWGVDDTHFSTHSVLICPPWNTDFTYKVRERMDGNTGMNLTLYSHPDKDKANLMLEWWPTSEAYIKRRFANNPNFLSIVDAAQSLGDPKEASEYRLGFNISTMSQTPQFEVWIGQENEMSDEQDTLRRNSLEARSALANRGDSGESDRQLGSYARHDARRWEKRIAELEQRRHHYESLTAKRGNRNSLLTMPIDSAFYTQVLQTSLGLIPKGTTRDETTLRLAYPSEEIASPIEPMRRNRLPITFHQVVSFAKDQSANLLHRT